MSARAILIIRYPPTTDKDTQPQDTMASRKGSAQPSTGARDETDHDHDQSRRREDPRDISRVCGAEIRESNSGESNSGPGR